MSRSAILAKDRCSKDVVSALAFEMLSNISSARALTVWILLSNKEYLQLAQLDIKAEDYLDFDSFRRDYLCTEFLSKYPFNTGIDRREVAMEQFIAVEKRLVSLSRRHLRSGSRPQLWSLTADAVIHTASRKIAKLLGPFSWSRAEASFGFGPGASASLPRSKGDAFYKFGNLNPTVTKGALPLAAVAVSRIPCWAEHLTGVRDPTFFDVYYTLSQNIVAGNRVTTVPKSAKTDRVIAIEPDLNMFLQKGIGALIRSRLRRVGIDLNDQTLNQQLAQDLSYATIDLTSASDSISLTVVEELLPDDWCSAIKACRSPRGTLPDGRLITYQKVSSMGNGFTFELESLIFWALCSSVMQLLNTKGRLCVYGDDIIVPTVCANHVCDVLLHFGFIPNQKKTHIHGFFRESCGKHYFMKSDVTPFYIRKDVDSPVKLIRVLNRIRDWSTLPVYGLDPLLESTYKKGLSLLPSKLRRPTCPRSIPIGLYGDFDEARPTFLKSLQALRVVGYSENDSRYKAGELPYLLRSLANLEGRTDKEVVQEGGVTRPRLGYKIVKSHTTRWESHGPWLRP